MVDVMMNNVLFEGLFYWGGSWYGMRGDRGWNGGVVNLKRDVMSLV